MLFPSNVSSVLRRMNFPRLFANALGALCSVLGFGLAIRLELLATLAHEGLVWQCRPPFPIDAELQFCFPGNISRSLLAVHSQSFSFLQSGWGAQHPRQLRSEVHSCPIAVMLLDSTATHSEALTPAVLTATPLIHCDGSFPYETSHNSFLPFLYRQSSELLLWFGEKSQFMAAH